MVALLSVDSNNPNRWLLTPGLACVMLFCASATTVAADGSAGSFENAAAVLAQHCVRCHNEIDREGDLSIQTSKSLAESGFVVPGDPSSHLLSVVEPDGDEPPMMPKEGDPLSPAEVQAIRQWIESDTPWPDGATIEDALADNYTALRRSFGGATERATYFSILNPQ